MSDLTPAQKVAAWGAALLAKMQGADDAKLSPQGEASYAAALKCAETGGVTRYRRRNNPGAGIVIFDSPLLVMRVHPKFPRNPMLAARGMDRRTLASAIRGRTCAKLKDGTRTYQRWLKPGEIDAWTANLVDAWLRAKMAAKQGWTFAPSRRR